MAEKKDIFVLLQQDHEKIGKLLRQLTDTSTAAVKARRELLDKIETELQVHAAVEEEIFYPAYKEAVGQTPDERLFYEAAEEHHLVDVVLEEMADTEPSSPEFTAKAKVLQDLVEHHEKEEEQEMFPRAKRAIDASELERMASELEARKSELLDQIT